ncbi:tetratricopeptide repeat protein [Acetobacter farinalis]|uniref:Tetratricopeptide repeat protein n=1 Tax=Acetobacter farinalis TaxID=1260984 RepID=A0ABT3Q792_9PROT|nr:tetratricopeptide repeat protein [Acetobacter farinalis]MCX2561158.1 tetratricopeptide repeat protein [Acetobacter farinalis]
MLLSRPALIFCLPALLLTACVQAPPSTPDTSRLMMQAAQNPDALARIGQTALQTGDVTTAVTFYSRAVTLRPDRIDLQIGYAQALTASGKANDALGLLMPLAAKNPDNARLYLVTGRLLIEAGRAREALNILQTAQHQTPSDIHILVALGVTLDTLGNQQAAQGYYQQALAQNPDDIAARTDMALSLALSGSYPQALGILRPLRGELAGTGQTAHAAAVENALALVYGLMGDHAMSSAILRHRLSEQQTQENLAFYDAVRHTAAQAPPSP